MNPIYVTHCRKCTSFFMIFYLGIFLFFTLISNAQQKRNLLASIIQKQNIDSINSVMYRPISQTDLRNSLLKLPQSVQKKILTDANEVINYNWPSIPATSYLDFFRNGNRTKMEKYWSDGLAVLKKIALAEVLENKGAYLDAIINGSWAMCEESTWVLSAHLSSQKGGAGIPNITEPIIDLGAGENAATLAWVYYLFKDDFGKISPFLKARIPYEINRRIIKPYIDRDDFWWMGFKNENFVNNWNPWCNFNVVLSTLLLGNEVESKVRTQVVMKSMRSVDKFINYYKEDGACEEGPAYWSHAAAKMMEYLELLKNYSNGKISLSEAPIIKKMGKYIVDAHINEDFYINFADSSVRLQTDPGLVFRYGNYINDTALKQFGSFLASQQDFYKNPTKDYLDGAIHNCMIYSNIQSTPAVKSNQSFFWYNGTELAGGRSDIDASKGFFFAAKGGYNDESHNHNDVGTFILYHEGQPLLVDIGVETYSSKTFGPKRYEIWTMQSDYHNLPLINGFSQAYGKKYKASDVVFKNSKSQIQFSLNIAKAYPDGVMCSYWERNYILKKTAEPQLIINEQYSIKEIKGKTEEHFITTDYPILEKEGKIKLKENDKKMVFLLYPSDYFDAKIEQLSLTDKRLLSSWKQDNLYRLILTDKKKKLNHRFTLKIVEKTK